MPLTTYHWGTYEIVSENGVLKSLKPFAEDKDPSRIGPSYVDLLDHPARIKTPCVRKSWLDNGPGSHTSARGSDPFVAVSWDEAETLVANELDRVRTRHGNSAIYAGSYGWASAGRFHHAQSQIHRFLNCIGGYTRSVNTYSYAAAEVVVPHVIGGFVNMLNQHTSWTAIAEHCELFVAFGGLVTDNGQIGNGGTGCHIQRDGIASSSANGVEFVNISPRRVDIEGGASPRWIPVRPNADTAMMLALCHTLRHDGLADTDFIDRYAVGYEAFAAYLDGVNDGVVKSADWAAPLCGIAADQIIALAHEMASKRTMIGVSWSLSRQEWGEQPYWAAIAVATMLGQMGLAGGGVGFGYAIANHMGNNVRRMSYPALPQGRNRVSDFIPVARISDMLLNPGTSFDYDGKTHQYADTKIVYWAGGNPFHHHQDLNRMRRAWEQPDTIIVHDWCWNAAAKHADIVLPCTVPLERSDIGMTPRDPYIVAMAKAADPAGVARNDYDILAGIAAKMGVEDAFTEGRSVDDWLRWLWDETRKRAKVNDIALPDYDKFVEGEYYKLDPVEHQRVMFEEFRANPETSPLATPSGKIELFSETVAAFGYDDCPGHATWNVPAEWMGSASSDFPLHLIGKQPPAKLHSQLDHGRYSESFKIRGHEPVEIHPADAAMRGLEDGDIVQVFNARGSMLCGVSITDSILQGVVAVSTGAWYDPADPADSLGMCKHGNPNMVAPDRPTSRIAQGPGAHSCLVNITRYDGPPVTITAHQPPDIITAGQADEPDQR